LAPGSDSQTKRFQYLLGLSSQIERERIESDYFADVDTFQKMLAAEDDLIDSYARGELTVEERLRFEKKFLTSAQGINKVKFARAFAGAVSEPGPVQSATPPAWLVSSFQVSSRVLRIAAISAAVLAGVVLSWLVLDRTRMSDELRNLRAQTAELRKQSEGLERRRQTEQTPPANLAVQLENFSAQTQNNSVRVTDRASRKEAKPKRASLVNTHDATLGNVFVHQQITRLPLDARHIANLLSLQPGTPSGSVSGARADQANITLGGVVVTDPPIPGRAFEDPLTLRVGIPVLISMPISNEWIRLRLIVDGAAQHTDYRAIVHAGDGRPVFSVDWIEPFTPDQTAIDTPVIPTIDLPSGEYRLLLLGKEPDGSFVKVADYPFKVLRSLSPSP
jgi:hypothetical protein